MLDLVIIGSGPAGMSAAIYAGRANLSSVVIEKEYMGTGQIADSNKVDNYPGIPDIDGFSLGEAFREHAGKLGTEFVEGEVVSLKDEIENDTVIWTCSLDNGQVFKSKAVIFAAGCRHRHLGVPGEEKYYGRGISYCAVCDGAFYKGKTVAVVGGGDTALDDAMYLSDICEKVYLIHRRDEFRGAAGTVNKLKLKENVEIKTSARVCEILGDKKLEGILLDTGDKLNVSGLFVAVGMVPETDIIKELNVLDERGYIIASEDCRTAKRGLFAAGDARTKKLRQVVTAVADGANAVISALEYMR